VTSKQEQISGAIPLSEDPDLRVMGLTVEEEEVNARRWKISIVSSELDLMDQKTLPSQCSH
jgi:hypothetical protein